MPEPPRHVTYQVAEREITRTAVTETAGCYALVPGERSAVPLREEDPRLSNTRIEHSELHPLLSGPLGRPWGGLGGRQTAFGGEAEPWPLALAQDALRA